MRGWFPGCTFILKRTLLNTDLLWYTREGSPLDVDNHLSLIHTEETSLSEVEFHSMLFRGPCKKT